MKTHKQALFLAVLTGLAGAARGQTLIDLRTQSKNVDFSSAPFTKPSKAGTALPSTCGVGETYFKTDAQAGKNHYGCTSPNVWTVQGGNGLSEISAGDATCLKIGGDKYVFDLGQTKAVFTVNSPAKFCITGGNTLEVARLSLVYNNGTPQLVGDGVGNTYSFSSGGGSCGGFGSCMVTSTGSWPTDFFIPLATIATTNTAKFSQAPVDLSDSRNAIGAKVQRSGAGITGAETGTTSVDFNSVTSYAVGAALPGACNYTQQLYLLQDSTNNVYQAYQCVNGKYAPANFLYGLAADRPANCTAGQVYLTTDTQLLSYAAITANPCNWLNVAGTGTVTGAGAALTAHGVVLGNGGQEVRTLSALGANQQVLTSNGPGVDPSWQTAGSGTVTSVCMAGDGTVFNSTVSGSCVTVSGTLAPGLAAQTPNTALRGNPSGSTANTPTFRHDVLADLPVITPNHLFGADAGGNPADVAPRYGVTQTGANLDFYPDPRAFWIKHEFGNNTNSTASGLISDGYYIGKFNTTNCGSSVAGADSTIGDYTRTTAAATAGEGCVMDHGTGAGRLDASSIYTNGWKWNTAIRIDPQTAAAPLANYAASAGLFGSGLNGSQSLVSNNGMGLAVDTNSTAVTTCVALDSAANNCADAAHPTAGHVFFWSSNGSNKWVCDTGVAAQSQDVYQLVVTSTTLGTVRFLLSVNGAAPAYQCTVSSGTYISALNTLAPGISFTTRSSAGSRSLDWALFTFFGSPTKWF